MHPFEKLNVPEGKIGIHWFGQNSFAIKNGDGMIIQIDPYFPKNRPGEKYIHTTSPLEEETLPTDFVLLTHDHGDHTCIESILRIHGAFPKARFIGPAESARRMKGNGVQETVVTEISPGDTVSLNDLSVHAFRSKPKDGDPAHGIDPPDVRHLGYVIDTGIVRVYVSGDCISTLADMDDLLDPIAALKPEIGFLTTHPTEGEFPFFEGSVRMAVKLGLKTVVPAHYECFVKRTYVPKDWAAQFTDAGPAPLIIPYNDHILYPALV
jgi:L-ascorbate metabolism protein UlaG (beta-lactamase superfamily)